MVIFGANREGNQFIHWRFATAALQYTDTGTAYRILPSIEELATQQVF